MHMIRKCCRFQYCNIFHFTYFSQNLPDFSAQCPKHDLPPFLSSFQSSCLCFAEAQIYRRMPVFWAFSYVRKIFLWQIFLTLTPMIPLCRISNLDEKYRISGIFRNIIITEKYYSLATDLFTVPEKYATIYKKEGYY